jgi:hypothetical protein
VRLRASKKRLTNGSIGVLAAPYASAATTAPAISARLAWPQ